jgi:O-antigen ligase
LNKDSTLLFILVLAAGLTAGYLAVHYPASTLLYIILGLVIFTVAFVKTEIALYILVFSMLLSPEFGAGEVQGGATLGRGATLRLDDFLLVIIGFSWLAKNAINKELGLFVKTPLNRPIVFYVLACIISTGFGIMGGRVHAKTGFFYVLKYMEYFIVFFMVANYLENMDQLKRFIFCLMLTCFITSVIGMLQIPAGGRVSAPFEGRSGEPNTFGGYLIFIGGVAAGLLMHITDRKTRRLLVVLLVAVVPPLLFTQSRSSYLAAVSTIFVLGFMMKRKAFSIGMIVVILILSPLFLPSQVKERILYTFQQREHPGQHVTIGGVRLDTSTSARIASWKAAMRDWARRPIFGHGVTGYAFVDAQFPRVLVETGIVGFAAFLYLLYYIFKLTISTLNTVKTPYASGIVVGFFAGYIGLLFHAIGANTFVIVRIMEPFWLVVGMIAVLPILEQRETTVDDNRYLRDGAA